MFKITKLFKTRPNDNYTGVIHMVKYMNTENKDDNGIMFVEQDFNDEEILKKTSFFEGDDSCVRLDEKSIEEDFGVEISFQYGQGEMITAVKKDDVWYFLYDDEIGTSLGQKFPIDNAKISTQVTNSMFRKLDGARSLVDDDYFEDAYQSLERLKGKIDSLRETADDMEEHYQYLKKRRRERFTKKMDGE